MARIEHINWSDISDEELQTSGNHWIRVYGTPPDGIVFEGYAAGWNETATGALSIRRQVQLPGTEGDDGEKVTASVEVVTIAARAWTRVVADSCMYQPEAWLRMKDQQKQQEAEQSRAEAAARLGIGQMPPGVGAAPPSPLPNRTQRHPGQPG
jgi:hypothetical protein